MVVAVALGFFAALHAGAQQEQAAPPATTLGIWTSAENNGTFSTISGQGPNVANIYEYWGSSFPTSFAAAADAAGATPFLEIEPWQGGGPSDCNFSANFPDMTTIGANGPAISSYLDSLGSAIASFGHPVIITFAHEFNVSGQYPWAQGDCEGTTAPQWIQAWKTVRTDVDSTANGLAYFMWAPNANTGGSTIDPTPYWPGSTEVDMVGVDGYPSTQFGAQFGTFSGLFGPTFAEIHALTSLPIFISETDLAPLDGSGYETIASFISDLCSDGGDGVLQFQDGTPDLSSTQWTELDNALASDCSGGSSPSASSTPSSTATLTPLPTSPTASVPAPTPLPTSSPASPGASASAGPPTAPPATAPVGFSADVQGSFVVLSWDAVATATEYEVMVNLPDGQLWRDNVIPATSATYDIVPTTGTYTYKVRAINSVNNGPWSALQSFTVTQ